MQTGTLYIVATPIGNLDDMTFRAVDILKHVDLIAAEDTRHASILCKHYKILTKRVSYYDEIEDKRSTELIKRLQAGEDVALVSNAGTPLINDPGFQLVTKAHKAGIPIVPVPGPSAVLSALVVSGLPVDRFCYEGFLPRKKGRKTRLEELAGDPRTLIILESPYRLLKTLKDIQQYWGNRKMVIARELTKRFEEVLNGQVTDMITTFTRKKPRGEFVLVIEGNRRK